MKKPTQNAYDVNEGASPETCCAPSHGYIPERPETDGGEAAANFPPVLDATCGSRAMWFNKRDSRALFFDQREESLKIPAGKAWPNGTTLHIRPDVKGSFTALPFPDESFRLVVFDPPHYEKLGAGDNSNMHRFYGRLLPSWETDLQQGFRECLRVLKEGGVLIFKWCSVEIPLSQVLNLAPEPPLFGHTAGRRDKTHWMTFIRTGAVAPASQEYNVRVSDSPGETSTNTENVR